MIKRWFQVLCEAPFSFHLSFWGNYSFVTEDQWNNNNYYYFQYLAMKTADENSCPVILANDPDSDRMALAEKQAR